MTQTQSSRFSLQVPSRDLGVLEMWHRPTLSLSPDITGSSWLMRLQRLKPAVWTRLKTCWWLLMFLYINLILLQDNDEMNTWLPQNQFHIIQCFLELIHFLHVSISTVALWAPFPFNFFSPSFLYSLCGINPADSDSVGFVVIESDLFLGSVDVSGRALAVSSSSAFEFLGLLVGSFKFPIGIRVCLMLRV